MAHDILLEAGTNEVEFLEFTLGNQCFGINVAKTRQMIRFDASAVTWLPDAHPAILGTILHNNRSVVLLDLRSHLKVKASSDTAFRLVIMTDFNQTQIGFVADGVNKIHRVSWEKLQPISGALAMYNPRVTGVVHIEDRQVLILDMESILADITPGGALAIDPSLALEGGGLDSLQETFRGLNIGGDDVVIKDAPAPSSASAALAAAGVEMPGAAPVTMEGDPAHKVRVLFAEDSHLFREGLLRVLRSIRNLEIDVHKDGMSAWQKLKKVEAARRSGEDHPPYDLIITDIEMPRMDGLTLCKNAKNLVPGIKVIILSSLITPEMEYKCKAVQADASLSKKQVSGLAVMMEALVNHTAAQAQAS